MNYRHAFHAGNFADVVKHVALAAVLLHLIKKDKPFRVIDSHAGRGLYDLGASEALRSGEAADGIARVRDLQDRAGLPASLSTYLQCVREEGGACYPGSPRLVARLLRPRDRLVAIDRHPAEAALLAEALAPFRNAKSLCADGYERLPALLPPPERRGLVLIDPPYEAPDEFVRATDALERAYRRFATGIFLLWFPIKSKAMADSFLGEVTARGIRKAIRIVVDLNRPQSETRLAAAGLLVVNPPFGFENEMHACGEILGPRLGDGHARITVHPFRES